MQQFCQHCTCRAWKRKHTQLRRSAGRRTLQGTGEIPHDLAATIAWTYVQRMHGCITEAICGARASAQEIAGRRGGAARAARVAGLRCGRMWPPACLCARLYATMRGPSLSQMLASTSRPFSKSRSVQPARRSRRATRCTMARARWCVSSQEASVKCVARTS